MSEQQARAIQAALKNDSHFPPSLAQIIRVVGAAVRLGFVEEVKQ